MVADRIKGSTGSKNSNQRIDCGTTNRSKTAAPTPTGFNHGARNVLDRITRFRNIGARMYPSAVAALDHYVGKSGKFVEIPASKVHSVRSEAEASHVDKARAAFKKVILLEAAEAWLSINGYPQTGGKLKPPYVDVKLGWQSGVATGGLTDDNLTYYGSTIFSEVVIRVTQKSFPVSVIDEGVDFTCSVVSWTSWVVDNYDWEGDKTFGAMGNKHFNVSIFKMLGLPTQREMNSLQLAGLAKSYQRSSHSWQNDTHALQPWSEYAGSLQTLRDVASDPLKAKKIREFYKQKEFADGALPTPRPAEEMLGK